MCVGVVVWSCTFYNTSQCTITGVLFSLPLTPLSLCNFFFDPPPLQIQFSFVNPISLFLLIPPWRDKEDNIYSPLPSSHTPHLLSTYLQSYAIWWGGQGKREEAGGEERKEGEGVGRGMKNVKILKRGKKGKFLRVSLRERRRETRGERGEA